MRRHPALEPFSRDHHHALILARTLTEGRHDATDELERRWIRDLRPHFAAEERLLIPFLTRAEADRLLAEHAALAEALASKVDLEQAGRLLQDHGRWEERSLFPAVEARLTRRQAMDLQGASDAYERMRWAASPRRAELIQRRWSRRHRSIP